LMWKPNYVNVCYQKMWMVCDKSRKVFSKFYFRHIFPDTDVALINKNAKLVGKNLDGAETTDHEIIIKREIHDEDKSTTEPTTTIRFVSETTVINDKIITTAEPEKETETDLNPEAIVGQAPQRRIHHPRLGPQRRQREPRPITPEQQHLMLQQIHDHLQRLEQLSDQRLRQIEIDAVNVSLRQLSQTVVHTPAQRSRFRNVVEETRRRQQRQRLGPHGRLVGAAAPHNIENSTAKTESEVESALKEIFHGKKQRHFEIITQDPRLIDE
jgi:hypothetical protein